MKPTFVKTKNYMRFLTGMDELGRRGAAECCLMVVDGKPGLGKTTILSKWAAENYCVYMRAKTEWTTNWFYGDFLAAIQCEPPHGRQKRYNALLERLGDLAKEADDAGRAFAIVIDEADHIVGRKQLVEAIRDFADTTEIATVLVGMDKIRGKIAHYPQVSSRVSKFVGFEPADFDDVRKFIDQKCEVKVADDLAKFVTTVTGGFNREILEAIRAIETFGFRNQVDLNGVTVQDMAGLTLINDRKSGRPIIVPGAN